ncbi:MAG TPA: HupE/UreJ family protein [Flavobacteriaceae bacterium]|nr:HupE/UreJ family protein [Flavobacteriaceae bacterium]MCB9212179.1 HupE/UreJ family protein [Alteromonas sp.]HPF10443.1 HupE/UreJ family protein [Flavobacteriaceae bacterium]HQU21752.1 HupE/UreJ family protein [Flavobacteriaceae bacterium]HQU64654.1 HupE/UreJ family protein [Flavobacteriaceae bacterium]
MSQFWLYFQLGLDHVLDWQAYDHVLFIIALCTAYAFSHWKRLLYLVSMFTLGHTFSLFVTHYELVSVSKSWIEFLIPITIMVAATYNIAMAGKPPKKDKVGVLFLVTLFFGIIHGLAFGTDFNQMIDDKEIAPLLEFALGIEISQVIIVLSVLVLGYFVQTFFRFQQRDWVLVVSAAIIGMAFPMLLENWPF